MLNKYQNESYKKPDEWNRKVSDFNCRMFVNAYNIKTKDKFFQKRLETIYGVKMTDEDEEFYLNDCCGSYSTTCNTLGTPRMWQKQTKRKKEREEFGQRKRMEMVRQAEDEQLAGKTCCDEAMQNI